MPILHRTEHAVAFLTLANPGKLNAIDLSMWRALAEMLPGIAADAAIRCVVIEGEGAHFAAGGDLKEFIECRATLEDAVAYHAEVDRALSAIKKCPKPVLAKIRGNCIGGGLEIACACDLRVCDDTARFGAPIHKLGFSMYPGEMKALIDVAGQAVLAEMLLEGRLFSAEEAASRGLVNRLVPTEQLDAEVAATVKRIQKGAPQVAAWHKHWLRRLRRDAPLTAEEKRASFAFLGTHDYQEGLTAFFEKRAPVFTGQ
ncbi:MAG: enoyl-CoA hydratase/isomerase family protein [Zoogloeaceae bacterium]|jgi:enoyl-CoA hydratase/carnithine racemase|nr:enoyl-CoA hydratase/isomerase family protein [Zoogloeaceae bacterium]